MVSGKNLLSFLDGHNKNEYDLVQYVFNGLPVYTSWNVPISYAKVQFSNLIGSYTRNIKEQEERVEFLRNCEDRPCEEEPSITELEMEESSLADTIRRLGRLGELKRRFENGEWLEMIEIAEFFGASRQQFKYLISDYCYDVRDIVRFVDMDDEEYNKKQEYIHRPYLDPKHNAYSSELAAAVIAWEAVYIGGWGEMYHSDRVRIESHIKQVQYANKTWKRGTTTIDAALHDRILTLITPDKAIRGGRPKGQKG